MARSESQGCFLLVRGLDRRVGCLEDDCVHPFGVDLRLQLRAQVLHQLCERGLAFLTPEGPSDCVARLFERLDSLRPNPGELQHAPLPVPEVERLGHIAGLFELERRLGKGRVDRRAVLLADELSVGGEVEEIPPAKLGFGIEATLFGQRTERPALGREQCEDVVTPLLCWRRERAWLGASPRDETPQGFL